MYRPFHISPQQEFPDLPGLQHVHTCVSVIPDFKNELVAAAVGERVLSSAGVRGATPEDEVTVIKQANEYTAKLMTF